MHTHTHILITHMLVYSFTHILIYIPIYSYAHILIYSFTHIQGKTASEAVAHLDVAQPALAPTPAVPVTPSVQHPQQALGRHVYVCMYVCLYVCVSKP